MGRNFIHINGIKYDAIKVVEELIASKELWKLKGWEFMIQLMDASEFAVKFNTSGTTGVPQVISFSKQQIFYSAKNTNSFFGISSSTKMLLCLPADFVAGRLMMARAYAAKADLIWIEPSLNPLKNIGEINFAAFTPAQVATIVADSTTKKVFENIDQVIIGGGEISNKLETELVKYKNNIFATYGMTETLTHIAVRRVGDAAYRSVYKEAVFSMDANNCLVIELPFIQPAKIVTKDIVELVDAYTFVWKGRLDNVINTGGIKLYAEEIEKKLINAGILNEGEFYISSKEDSIFGRSPVIVMLKGSINVELATFLTTINGLLNKHEAVKDVVFFDKFENTATGKLIRRKF